MDGKNIHDRYNDETLDGIRMAQKDGIAFDITKMITTALKYYDIELLPEAQDELLGKSKLFVYQTLKEYRDRAFLKSDGAK